MSGEVEATLADHTLTTPVQCSCGWREPDAPADQRTHATHLAAVLAPVVRAASERAVEEAALRVEAALNEAREAHRFAMAGDGNEQWRRGCHAGLHHAAEVVRDGGQS